MATDAEIRAALDSGMNRTAIASSLACGKSRIARIAGVKPQSQKPSGAGRGLSDFAAKYDKDTIVPAKIKAAIAELGAGWEYESEFVRRCGLSFNDLGNYREQFDDYWLQIKADGKRAWAGTKALIEKMREML